MATNISIRPLISPLAINFEPHQQLVVPVCVEASFLTGYIGLVFSSHSLLLQSSIQTANLLYVQITNPVSVILRNLANESLYLPPNTKIGEIIFIRICPGEVQQYLLVSSLFQPNSPISFRNVDINNNQTALLLHEIAEPLIEPVDINTVSSSDLPCAQIQTCNLQSEIDNYLNQMLHGTELD